MLWRKILFILAAGLLLGLGIGTLGLLAEENNPGGNGIKIEPGALVLALVLLLGIVLLGRAALHRIYRRHLRKQAQYLHDTAIAQVDRSTLTARSLREITTDPQSKEMITRIIEENSQAVRGMRRLLDPSLAGGKGGREEADLEATLREVGELLARREIELCSEVEIAGPAWRREGQLCRLLAECGQNAFKYAKASTPLYMSVEERGGGLEVCVTSQIDTARSGNRRIEAARGADGGADGCTASTAGAAVGAADDAASVAGGAVGVADDVASVAGGVQGSVAGGVQGSVAGGTQGGFGLRTLRDAIEANGGAMAYGMADQTWFVLAKLVRP